MEPQAHSPRPTVFVVDDDESVRISLGRLMRAEGFDVRLFGSSESFLSEASSMPFACVLLDITMPGMNGLDLQRCLSERGIRLSVIAVSARDDDMTRQEARNLGAVFFFRKPVDDRTLIDAINWVTSSGPDPRVP